MALSALFGLATVPTPKTSDERFGEVVNKSGKLRVSPASGHHASRHPSDPPLGSVIGLALNRLYTEIPPEWPSE